MKTITQKIDVYDFEDLQKSENKSIKENVLDAWRRGDSPNNDMDFFLEDLQNEIIPQKYPIFYDFEINYSGFWCQGDGASFTCKLYDSKLKDLLSMLNLKPSSKLLNSIEYVDIRIERICGIYCHRNTVTPSVDLRMEFYYPLSDDLDDLQNEIEDKLEIWKDNLCEEIYKMLEEHYEYMLSDEYILEHIEANEYEFTEDGQKVK